MTPNTSERTSRLPTLRRFRDERAKMAMDNAVARAETVTTVTAHVTDLIIAAQKEMDALRAERIETRDELFRALGEARENLSKDVVEKLQQLAADRIEPRADLRETLAEYKGKLSHDVLEMLQENAGARVENRTKFRDDMTAFRAELAKDVEAILSTDFA